MGKKRIKSAVKTSLIRGAYIRPKVIVKKSCREVSPVKQDTIDCGYLDRAIFSLFIKLAIYSQKLFFIKEI